MTDTNRRTQETPPAVVEHDELSPDFTDTARAALLWVLWHHQGGSSPVGQPIRFALGMGQHDRLNEHQLAEAKRWERLHPVNPAVFPRGPEPLTERQLMQCIAQAGCFGTVKMSFESGPYDIDRPTLNATKLCQTIEAAHGIGIKKGGSSPVGQPHAPAPAAQGDALPREDFAWMVVQEACDTEPADEDDPECIRILRRDLKSAVLAAFLREDAARAQQEHKP